jgi:flagellar basal-body rod protein FlgB
MEAIWDSANYSATRQLLDAAYKSQKVYASNLAHVNTPGYQRRTVDTSFLDAVRAQLAAGKVSGTDMPDFEVKVDTEAESVSPSGNTVNLASELQALQDNALSYNYLTRSARGRFDKLHMAITGRV